VLRWNRKIRQWQLLLAVRVTQRTGKVLFDHTLSPTIDLDLGPNTKMLYPFELLWYCGKVAFILSMVERSSAAVPETRSE
jgi:hypothetical protein